MANISDWIRGHADERPDAPAIRYFGGDGWSYGELQQHIRRWVSVLQSDLNISAGDRLAYLGYNNREMLALLFACADIGAILVPLNWRLAAKEHAWILNHCTPTAIFGEADFLDHLDAIRPEIPKMACVAVESDAPNWRSLDAMLAAAETTDVADGPDRMSEPLLLVYTSGTTGRPKGALLQQSALYHNALNIVDVHDISAQDHAQTVLPLFHVGGLNIQTTPMLYVGGSITLHRQFNPDDMLRDIAENRPTIALAVPAVSQALIRHPAWTDTDLSSLRLVGMGSSTVPEALMRPWLERGVAVSQIYGLTESCPVATVTPVAAAYDNPASCGKPVRHCQARIIDDDGQDLAVGEKGEIALKGANLFKEYWRDPVTTEASFIDGWFRTGDIGHMDPEGYFYVDDRKKDVIISGGENIYPAELENVLADCPEIENFAVIGLPHPKWVETPVACVVLKPGAEFGASDVLSLFEGRIARYKHPRQVIFLDALPINAMGKVQKFALREQLANFNSPSD